MRRGWVILATKMKPKMANLSLLVLRAQAGRSGLHNIGELDDSGDGVLSGHGQLLLAGGGPRHQRLRVLHQRLGRLQYVLPVT